MIRWLLGGGSGFSNRKKHTPLPRCASLSDIPCYSETIASLGHTPAQVRQDEEDMQIMRVLGRNMAWMLKGFAKQDAESAFADHIETDYRTDFNH